MAVPASPICVVVMGVSGAGKTTLGAALADALGVVFVEGDTLHPPANIARMTAGAPLDDDDRAPFLTAVGEVLRRASSGSGVVVTCSALKRRYRDGLRAAQPHVRFVLPVVEEDVLAQRLAQRRGHFMPAALLHSQLADFEPPDSDEAVAWVDGALPQAEQVAQALKGLGWAGA